jgi:REP element-mobilizing transposase RayT
MPRQARLDAPGTLHHVIIRGIEKRKIVTDDKDRKKFVARLSQLAEDTRTAIYAWALLNNHAHILLRSSEIGLSRFMRRLLTAYAINYNLRHKRQGHLFQNRYKSIVCEEDNYFRELVRYIHLNPLRANLVRNSGELDSYRWCGHSALMGKRVNDWQDRDYVLKWFGRKEGEAKKAYREYVKKGIEKGRPPELVGGGLIRSLGGWSQVKSMRHLGIHEHSDERILGSGDFVKQVIKEASIKVKYQFPENELMGKVDEFISTICHYENINIIEMRSGSRRKRVSKVRAQIAIGLIEKYGISMAEAARRLGVSTSAISKIVNR